VGARCMGHSISEVVLTFDISRSTVSRVYVEYLMEDITTHCRQRSGRPRVLNDCDQPHRARIVCGNRQAALAEITPIFNVGGARHTSGRPVQRSLDTMGYRSRRLTKVPLLTPRYWTKCLTWAYDIINWTLEWQHSAWCDESRY
jgi:hypothetical protein